MKNSIYPCLWFDGNAQEAVALYTSVFKNSSIQQSTPMVTTFDLSGQHFMALNGGPMFIPNPSISFYVTLSDIDELKAAWNALSTDGKVLMPLDQYPWNEQYGWLQDKYNISWQLSLGNPKEVGQAVVPMMMFCGKQQGKAEAAIDFYTHVFSNSEIIFAAEYEAGQTQVEAKIVHSRIKVDDNLIMIMDSAVAQPFDFNEGISLVVTCETQQEIDYYWDKFTEKDEESMCGWCKDQFGVSWQVIPSILGPLMSDPEKGQRVSQELFKMRKLDIERLKSA